ncbi:MAG TPA: hypothetical protein VMX33_14925 [bacterium]|nr:hypothetical protein [bacterium]
MRSRAVAIIAFVFLLIASASAQEVVQTPEQPSPAQPGPAQPAITAPAAVSAPASVAAKADALLLYKQGRDLEAAGKKAEATAKYRDSIVICDKELAGDPTRMDSYTVKCWSLFRLERYREVIDLGNAGLKIKFDARIVEVMGEAFYYLNDDASTVRYLQRYLDNTGEYGDRVPTAFFYLAESYVRQKKLDHADIAYSMAVYREPGIARWWYRYASVAEALGDNARAYTLYTKALALSPGLTEAVEGQTRVKARL